MNLMSLFHKYNVVININDLMSMKNGLMFLHLKWTIKSDNFIVDQK